ncbi:MAG: carboxypeptidase regulatory-like domain-containing protein [Spirochaetales bacterium]|nr:carboxypeptidase regulatory-like domain-containing protein [Spirochaetales bacterium]
MKRNAVFPVITIISAVLFLSCNLLDNPESPGSALAGITGTVYEEPEGGEDGDFIADTVITFTSEDESFSTEVVSNGNGSYQVILPAGSYSVTAVNYDYDIYRGDGLVQVAEDSISELDIYLGELSSMYHGEVIEQFADNSFGDDIAGVLLTFTSEYGGRVSETVTNADGGYSISLHPGRYTVRAYHEDYKVYDTVGDGFWVVEEQTDHIGMVYLHELVSGFHGHCQEELADGTLGGYIDNVIIIFTSEDDAIEKETVSAAGGSYEITLQAGRYKVRTIHPGYDSYDLEVLGGFFVVNEDSDQIGNFFLKTLEGGFQGHVLKDNPYPAADDPIAGALLTFTSEDGRLIQTATSDASGHYIVDLPHAHYYLRIEHPDYLTYYSGTIKFTVTGSGYSYLARYLDEN